MMALRRGILAYNDGKGNTKIMGQAPITTKLLLVSKLCQPTLVGHLDRVGHRGVGHTDGRRLGLSNLYLGRTRQRREQRRGLGEDVGSLTSSGSTVGICRLRCNLVRRVLGHWTAGIVHIDIGRAFPTGDSFAPRRRVRDHSCRTLWTLWTSKLGK